MEKLHVSDDGFQIFHQKRHKAAESGVDIFQASVYRGWDIGRRELPAISIEISIPQLFEENSFTGVFKLLKILQYWSQKMYASTQLHDLKPVVSITTSQALTKICTVKAAILPFLYETST